MRCANGELPAPRLTFSKSSRFRLTVRSAQWSLACWRPITRIAVLLPGSGFMNRQLQTFSKGYAMRLISSTSQLRSPETFQTNRTHVDLQKAALCEPPAVTHKSLEPLVPRES